MVFKIKRGDLGDLLYYKYGKFYDYSSFIDFILKHTTYTEISHIDYTYLGRFKCIPMKEVFKKEYANKVVDSYYSPEFDSYALIDDLADRLDLDEEYSLDETLEIECSIYDFILYDLLDIGCENTKTYLEMNKITENSILNYKDIEDLFYHNKSIDLKVNKYPYIVVSDYSYIRNRLYKDYTIVSVDEDNRDLFFKEDKALLKLKDDYIIEEE